MDWGFYGRHAELEQVSQILLRNRWFFAQITGRRRIGKTRLIQHALESRPQQPANSTVSGAFLNMSLPFLKPKAQPGTVTIITRKPDDADADSGSNSAIEAAAQDIMRAIESKDAPHLANALRSAYQILEAEDDIEGPNLNESEGE